MRWRYPLIFVAIALLIFVVGIPYGVAMVGVPTQDPTPAVAAAEARDVRISSWLMLAGACMGVVALLWLGVVAINRFGVRRLSAEAGASPARE